MIASAPSDFSEVVNMGMRLEEGVQEGRLVKDSVPAGSSKKKEHEVSMVKGQPQRRNPTYQHIAAVIPVTKAIQNPGYQPQLQSYQQQQ